jgi:hypothetical protein
MILGANREYVVQLVRFSVVELAHSDLSPQLGTNVHILLDLFQNLTGAILLVVYSWCARRQRDGYGDFINFEDLPAQYIGGAHRIGLHLETWRLVVFSQYFYRLRKASIRVLFRSLDMPSMFWSVPALVDISAGMPTPWLGFTKDFRVCLFAVTENQRWPAVHCRALLHSGTCICWLIQRNHLEWT